MFDPYEFADIEDTLHLSQRLYHLLETPTEFLGDKIWITKDNKRILFKNLTENHIKNILRYFSNDSSVQSVLRRELKRRKIEAFFSKNIEDY